MIKIKPKTSVRLTIKHKIEHNRVINNDKKLYKQLFRSLIWKVSRTISVTMSTRYEINTRPIIKRAWKERKQVCVPKIYPHQEMRMCLITPHTRWTRDKFRILEPSHTHTIPKDDIQLIIVPGMAFSLSDNQRLGYGGGYYDKYLKDYHGTTVGLADKNRCKQIRNWQIDKNDVPVNKIIW